MGWRTTAQPLLSRSNAGQAGDRSARPGCHAAHAASVPAGCEGATRPGGEPTGAIRQSSVRAVGAREPAGGPNRSADAKNICSTVVSGRAERVKLPEQREGWLRQIAAARHDFSVNTSARRKKYQRPTEGVDRPRRDGECAKSADADAAGGSGDGECRRARGNSLSTRVDCQNRRSERHEEVGRRKNLASNPY